MTQEQDKEDAQWLAALSGRPGTDVDSAVARQASALRTALLARSQELDQQTPVADDLIYQQYLFRLRQERLYRSDRPWTPVVQWGQGKGQMVARLIASNGVAAWAAAGLVVLVCVLLVQNLMLQKSQDDASAARSQLLLRGGTGIVQIADDPERRASELQAGLKAAGASPILERDRNGKLRAVVKASPEVLDYLATQRLEMATPDKEGYIAIVVEKSKK